MPTARDLTDALLMSERHGSATAGTAPGTGARDGRRLSGIREIHERVPKLGTSNGIPQVRVPSHMVRSGFPFAWKGSQSCVLHVFPDEHAAALPLLARGFPDHVLDAVRLLNVVQKLLRRAGIG